MKKVLIAGVILLIIGVNVYYMLSNKNASSDTEVTTEAEIVDMDNTPEEPEEPVTTVNIDSLEKAKKAEEARLKKEEDKLKQMYSDCDKHIEGIQSLLKRVKAGLSLDGADAEYTKMRTEAYDVCLSNDKKLQELDVKFNELFE